MRWPRVKVESLKAETRNALVGGPFGSELTTRHYVEEGVPVIRGANLPDDQSFKDNDFVFVSEEKADLLSAYDEMMENNRRRMGLLEESARLLYREWFVRLRFPGHEHTRIVDGLPEGWEHCKIATLVKRVPPGKLFSQETAQPEGAVPILDQGRSGV